MFRRFPDQVEVVLKYGNSNMTGAFTCANANDAVEEMFNRLIEGIESKEADLVIKEHMEKQREIARLRDLARKRNA